MEKLKDYNFNIQKQLLPLTRTYKKIRFIQKEIGLEFKNRCTQNYLFRRHWVYISQPYFETDGTIESIEITPDNGKFVNNKYYFRCNFMCWVDKRRKSSAFRPEQYVVPVLNIVRTFKGTTKELREYWNENPPSF